MLRFHNYEIVFQEVPDEVTLAINVTNCPNACKGCHSSHLQKNTGEFLTKKVLEHLLAKYGEAITCICFMGGDRKPQEIEKLSVFIKKTTEGRIKTAWYSGKNSFPSLCSLQNFDYVKLGAYVEKLGGLGTFATNQRFYKIEVGEMIDTTNKFLKD